MSAQPERARRLFVALWPAEELRHDIEHETRQAARHSGGRVMPARNLHITLAFLGPVIETRVADARECVTSTSVKPFELLLGEIAWWQQQELLCLEPTAGVKELVELVDQLRAALRRSGFVIEHRPFRPHVTLARDVRRKHAFNPIRQLHWQVNRIELLASEALAAGSSYTILPT
jgi:2'-5' RNA ligase